MSQYPNYWEMQRQNEMRKITEAQNRLAYLEQQSQMQNQNNFQNQMINQNQVQFLGLNGRIVDDFSTLNANDVPMDNTGAVFIKRDGAEIQWRRWGNMGNIEMTSYKPILEQNNQDGANIPQMDFNGLYEDVKALRTEITDRFDRLEKSMTDVSAKTTAKTSTARTKKEVASDE